MDDLKSTGQDSQIAGPVYPLDPKTLYLPREEARQVGARYAEQYQSAEPYPHIVLDNFLPIEICDEVRQQALLMKRKIPENASPQEHLKTSYNPEEMPDYARLLFMALNSATFLAFLESITGVSGLIPDPYYKGGGIHRTNNGGYLGVHADFNHHRQMNLERRLNFLIYLNPDWKPEYGGAFEIWTPDMKTQVNTCTPVMNRMCLFNTSSTSMHGNPEPVNHPEGQPRLSIALYYYTATWTSNHVSHSTLFRPRPGANDVVTRKEDIRRLIRKYTPPVLPAALERLMPKKRP